MKQGPIGIIGAGTMGSGIAQVVAQADKKVLLVDRSTELVEQAVTALAGRLSKRVEQQKMAQAEMDTILGNIHPAGSLKELQDASVIIEAVFEDPEVKMAMFRELEGAYDRETLVATNTSGIPVTLLATSVKYPERFVGMHFFNPAPAMRLVEVVKGYLSGDDAVEQAVSLTQAIGKTPVVVKDSPGFVANRILGPMINEAVLLLSEGIASRDHIDIVMKLGANHPMGPLELADLIGLDICLHEIETLHAEFGDSKYRAAPRLKQMVTAGNLGRKTGKGFYDYS